MLPLDIGTYVIPIFKHILITTWNEWAHWLYWWECLSNNYRSQWYHEYIYIYIFFIFNKEYNSKLLNFTNDEVNKIAQN